MPIVSVPGTDLSYDLIAFDAQGRERQDDPDGLMSRRAVETIAQGQITDVFLFSHGWLGDVAGAERQYAAWVGAMAACPSDIARIKQARPGFRPLLIGLHWPSLPFGDDALGAAVGMVAAAVDPVSAIVETGAATTADTPAARDALRTIADAAVGKRAVAPTSLPPDVVDAYNALNREMGLGSAGVAAAPGDDRLPFDPERTFRAALSASEDLGGELGNALLSPLRTLSFWQMKDRARRLGEGAMHQFLGALVGAVPEGARVRFHLMGHSFGCIVTSAMVAGPPTGGLNLQVDSLALVEGALALWSYCADVPAAPGQPGYFRRLIDQHRVRGPIFTTTSTFDRAVGTWYPFAAGVAHQVVLLVAGPPEYGALGAFGMNGPGVDASDKTILMITATYGFAPGKAYNIESSQVIRHGGGFAGAHNDIAHPEVAHAVWEAALV